MMNTLIILHEQDIDPGAPFVDPADFGTREAARAVVSDERGRVALLHVALHGYHKLPGGGVDPGEKVPDALARELVEEVGCTAEVTGEIGQTVEYRDRFRLLQTSHAFMARVIGAVGEPDLTEEERAQGFEVVWADSLTSAIETLEKDRPKNYEGKFIRQRDLAILGAANRKTS